MKKECQVLLDNNKKDDGKCNFCIVHVIILYYFILQVYFRVSLKTQKSHHPGFCTNTQEKAVFVMGYALHKQVKWTKGGDEHT